MSVGGWIQIGFAAALLTAVGCGGDSGSSSTHTFACSDGGVALGQQVALRCGGAAAPTERVDVILGGPASGSLTLRGFSFDVVYDPAKVEFVPDASYASTLFPNALIAVTLAGGAQGRVVVGIQQPNGLADVTVVAGQQHVLSLSFKPVTGVTFGPTPLTFENAEATSASDTVEFTSALALAY